MEFEVGDAEEMTYEDASFDVVPSTCGVMFAPDHEDDRERARAGHAARRTHRSRLLDSPRAGLHRRVQDDGAVHAASCAGRREPFRMG